MVVTILGTGAGPVDGCAGAGGGVAGDGGVGRHVQPHPRRGPGGRLPRVLHPPARRRLLARPRGRRLHRRDNLQQDGGPGRGAGWQETEAEVNGSLLTFLELNLWHFKVASLMDGHLSIFDLINLYYLGVLYLFLFWLKVG